MRSSVRIELVGPGVARPSDRERSKESLGYVLGLACCTVRALLSMRMDSARQKVKCGISGGRPPPGLEGVPSGPAQRRAFLGPVVSPRGWGTREHRPGLGRSRGSRSHYGRLRASPVISITCPSTTSTEAPWGRSHASTIPSSGATPSRFSPVLRASRRRSSRAFSPPRNSSPPCTARHRCCR